MLEINSFKYEVEYNYVCILSLYYDVIKIAFILLRYIEYQIILYQFQSYRSNCDVIHFYCIIPQRITNILKPTSTQLATISCLSSLKLECEKLASEKVEIQRHYVMVREENDIKVFMYRNICCVVFCVMLYVI